MNAEQFLEELGNVFDKHPKPQQLGIYRDKLRRFSQEQLLELLNKVLEEAKYFPKVSEIYRAAQELGYLSVDTATFKPHHWRTTDDCGLCRGEGRIAIIWVASRERRGDNSLDVVELSQVFQYSKSFDYPLKPNEFRSLWRCKCSAGDAKTLPKIWPKWSRSRETRREEWS